MRRYKCNNMKCKNYGSHTGKSKYCRECKSRTVKA